MSLVFPPSLNLALTPTPLHPLDRLSEQLKGPRIWIKRDDLTGSVLSGNKVRKLNYVIAQALADDCQVLITCGGIQSNHCRATAIAGAQLGLEVCLILREDFNGEVDGNLLLDELAGAKINIYGRDEYVKKQSDLFRYWADFYRAQGKKAMLIPTGASDDIGVWGYVECSRELAEDFVQHSITPQHVYTATGSGGTQAGLTAGLALYHQASKVIGVAVCDSESYFLDKVRSDLLAWQARYAVNINLEQISINVNANYIGPGYAKADRPVFETIAMLARTEGIVLDPVYTGKAFHALITEIERGSHQHESDIVFVHTGGIFGLFAQKQSLLAVLSPSDN